MPAGRPAMGSKLVDRFPASEDAKMKLKAILDSEGKSAGGAGSGT